MYINQVFAMGQSMVQRWQLTLPFPETVRVTTWSDLSDPTPRRVAPSNSTWSYDVTALFANHFYVKLLCNVRLSHNIDLHQ